MDLSSNGPGDPLEDEPLERFLLQGVLRFRVDAAMPEDTDAYLALAVGTRPQDRPVLAVMNRNNQRPQLTTLGPDFSMLATRFVVGLGRWWSKALLK